jgi:hypothetical protein
VIRLKLLQLRSPTAAPTGGKEGDRNPGLRQAAGSRRGGGCPGCVGSRAVKRCGRAQEPSWPIEEGGVGVVCAEEPRLTPSSFASTYLPCSHGARMGTCRGHRKRRRGGHRGDGERQTPPCCFTTLERQMKGEMRAGAGEGDRVVVLKEEGLRSV